MTKNLRCRDIESLLLEGEDRAFTAGERRLVEDHLRGCGNCRGFASDRTLIREELAAVRWPAPPDELVLKTRRLFRRSETTPAPIPVWVLIALAVGTVITALGLTVSLADVTPDMTLADLPIAAVAAIVIIVQNALMLFFAPIVLRAIRARRGGFENVRS